MKFNRLDVSDELEVSRFRNGIKLSRPNADSIALLSSKIHAKHTVSSLLKMPCSIYFDDADGTIQKLNEHNAQFCDFDSVNQAIGKKYCGRFTRETAQLLLCNDRAAIKNKKIKIVEEDILLSNEDFSYQALSIKMPWYNGKNKIIGLFGCSITLGRNPLFTSLELIANMGLLIPAEYLFTKIGINIESTYLSSQQRECAKFLLAGFSIKKIAIQMKLSPRTVECYINNLKNKLKCCNRVDLIIKLHEIIKFSGLI